MRLVYVGLIFLLTAAVVLFKFQNLDSVTISLFTRQLSMPASFLVFIVYVLGMITGGALLSLLRAWLHGATRRRH